MITQKFVNAKLIELGNKLLKKPYKDKWSADNPTFGYCYIVSEALYHFGGYNDPKPYVVNFGEEIGTHWWLLDADGLVIDYTSLQFDFEVDYSLGRRAVFFKGGIKTDKGYISKRGYEMAKILELI